MERADQVQTGLKEAKGSNPKQPHETATTLVSQAVSLVTHGLFATQASSTNLPESNAYQSKASEMLTMLAAEDEMLNDTNKVEANSKDKLLEGINLDRLAQLIDITRQRIEAAKDRDLILVIGRTGAGKSTTINYLMGCPMHVHDEGAETSLDVEEGHKPYAEIGHEGTSKTLCPQVIPTREFPETLAYVDLPGFKDNRILEEKLLASIALPMTLRLARSIRGVIVIIDYHDLVATRGIGFIDLLDILGAFRVSEQILFVFTKVPDKKDLKNIQVTLNKNKEGLLRKNQDYEQEFNKLIQALAKSVNKLTEWQQVNRQGNQEDKLRMRLTILKIASSASFSENPEIKNIRERYKVLQGEIKNTHIQLAGLELLLKQHQNHWFILRGNEQDDKDKLLAHIKNLQSIPPIAKENLALNSHKSGEWSDLDKIIQTIAEEGSQLLSTINDYPAELSSFKKYKRLLESQAKSQEEMLQKLKSFQYSEKELKDKQKELLNFRVVLEDCLKTSVEQKQAEEKKLKEKLADLDTAEPTRYEHRDLAPVTFNLSDIKAAISMVGSVFITSPMNLLMAPVAIVKFLTGIITESFDTAATKAAQLQLFAALNLYSSFTKIFHRFQYNDLPYLKVIKKCKPTTLYAEIAPNVPDSIIDLFEQRGFDLRDETIQPNQGKYAVTYRYLNDGNHQGKLTIWIELFVEKRNHPTVKPEIELIKMKLEWLEFIVNSYLKSHLAQLKEAFREEKELLEENTDAEVLQMKLEELIEKRLAHHSKSIKILRGIILGYQAKISENRRTLMKRKLRYTMLQQLANVIGVNTFVEAFLKDYTVYLSQNNNESLTTVWGRKQTPEQQPIYQVKEAKISGTAIGAFFKTEDKLNRAGWLGKLGYRSLSASESPKLMPFSRARRGSALESILEKIAADLYAYLSNGHYITPKTRLAELPIVNEFTKEHALTNELLQEINAGRSGTKITENVYLMSKYVEDYQNLADLTHCVIDETDEKSVEYLSFIQCLEKGRLPEQVLIEKKIVPLKGLMEVLAVSRLLADTDALGGGAKNAGFLIERDANSQPAAVRVVKIDPGYAFNFTGRENLFYESFNSIASPQHLLKQDKRNLQYGNMAKPLLWENLTQAQQDQFISALNHGLSLLSDHEAVLRQFAFREAFKQTPKQRLLFDIKEYLKDLQKNLNWQQDAYHAELAYFRESSRQYSMSP